MTTFKFFAAALILAIIAAILRKRLHRKALFAILREFNQANDTSVLIRWVLEKQSIQRLSAILEYFKDIEEEALAAEMLEHLDLDYLHHRHVLIFAAQAFATVGNPKALELAEKLYKEYPKDDSVLDTYIQAHLDLGSYAKAKEVLLPRLQRKYKGTIFMRHYARILAHEGDLERAIEIMEKVVKRDFILFQNTFAVPQKHLIRKQFEESRTILNSFREKKEGPEPETTAQAPD